MEQLESILTFHLAATLLMTGVIWIIQLVHYPSFMYIEKNKFVDFEMFHSKQISKVVIPLMLLELVTSVLLIYISSQQSLLFIANFLLLIATWLITLFFSARYHKKLVDGFNELYILKLIKTNWARTIFWTTRSVMLLFLFTKTVGDLN
jgi:hypothetical protein